MYIIISRLFLLEIEMKCKEIIIVIIIINKDAIF